jgi:AP-2 complex subunit alpha
MPHVHETLVKIGSYILSEYGVQLNKDPFKIFDVIHRHFDNCSHQGKAMLFNAYIKLAHVFPELENEVQSVLEMHTDHVNPDL